MTIEAEHDLPPELLALQREIATIARHYGLDFPKTIFEFVDYDEMSMMAAYGGFPVRYPHWRFGSQYDELMKGYTYGLQKIYEMVINTDPCYAYLLNCNGITDQKLVIAHVYGHGDFFKNNAWFEHTNIRMLDQMANHAARINRYIDRYGYEVVEQFVDACLSVEDLIDPHSVHIRRRPDPLQVEADRLKAEREREEDEHGLGESRGKFVAKGYMDPYINPPEVLHAEQAERRRLEEARTAHRRFPEEPVRDVMLFLLEHAPLRDWQHDIMAIVRDEAYYFAPQGMTKIMNEGWASYWHSTIMTRHGLSDAEIVDYADHHSGTMAMSGRQLNPYKIGIELYRDIEDRWNRGQFGSEWEACDDEEEKKHWDRKLGLGREKIFEVRKIHNDVTFIDNFLTEDFCRKNKFFSFAYNEEKKDYEIASREFKEIKAQLLNNLTNHGRPFISVVDGNYKNRGELYLRHDYQGIELKPDYAKATLTNLQRLWGRPVHIETVVDDHPRVMGFDGSRHEITDKAG